MQTFKRFFHGAAVLLGVAAVTFLAASCSDDNNENETTVVAATGIKVTPTKVTLREGKTQNLSVSVLPSNATDRKFTLTSNKPEVASVKNNTVTAVSVGEAIITATSNDGNFTATCTVTVEEAPEGNVVQLNDFTQGKVLFGGTHYGTAGLSNNWQIHLAGANYDVVNLKGKGAVLQFEVNTELGATDIIPSGTYTMIEKADPDPKDLLPNTVVPGLLDGSDQSPIGTWYFYSDTEGGDPVATNRMNGGSVEITTVGDTYTMKFNFSDSEQDITFEGTYTGTLIYFDMTQQ